MPVSENMYVFIPNVNIQLRYPTKGATVEGYNKIMECTTND